MTSPWVFRLAIIAAISILLMVASGSAVTANLAQPLAFPLPGPLTQSGHQLFSIPVSILAMILAIWLIAGGSGSRPLGWTIAVLDLAVGALGTPAWLKDSGPALPILHSLLAHTFFAATVAAVVVTSPGWQKPPEPVTDSGWPSLRSLSSIAPVLVLIQILLGALFRHKASGILPHIAGAIVVTLAILMMGMFVTQQCPTHRPLKSAAATMMTAVFCQIFLGIAALTARMINSTDTPMVVLVTGAHVIIGAMALGATLALSLQIRRHVVPKPAPAEA
jgi:hypothetical protein